MPSKVDLTKLSDDEKKVAEQTIEEYRRKEGRINAAIDKAANDYIRLRGLPITETSLRNRRDVLRMLLKLEQELANARKS